MDWHSPIGHFLSFFSFLRGTRLAYLLLPFELHPLDLRVETFAKTFQSGKFKDELRCLILIAIDLLLILHSRLKKLKHRQKATEAVVTIIGHRLTKSKFHLSSGILECTWEDKVGDGMSNDHIVSKEYQTNTK